MSEEYTLLVQLQANLVEQDSIQPERLKNAARQVLSMESAAEGSMLSIVISTDAHLQELNNSYRQIDSPTDILTFPADVPDEINEDPGYLGDIIISLPYVARRALQENREIHDELDLMVIHGTLHLLGYDHDTQEKQRTMWAVQSSALKALGITLDVPDYIHE